MELQIKFKQQLFVLFVSFYFVGVFVSSTNISSAFFTKKAVRVTAAGIT
jgi:hypothetical protein